MADGYLINFLFLHSLFMMSFYSSSSPLAIGWCLHAGFVIASLVGVVLFIIWAMKLKQDQLKQWIIWLLVIGTIGGLLTAPFSFMGWRGMMGNWDGKEFKGGWNMMNFGDDREVPATK